MMKYSTKTGSLVVVIIWSIVIVFLTMYNISTIAHWSLRVAESEAKASLNKDYLYRRWAALHGGVYVPPTDKTPPNPYLSHMPNRDITTTEGTKLTLINPAYMTRQVHELGNESYGVQGHITSLNPLRPENRPDPWERKILKKFKEKPQGYSSIDSIKGEPHFRYMEPLKTIESCLPCHAQQGYKVGDIRGGLSVSVPLSPFYKAAEKQKQATIISYFTIWIIGVVCIAIATILIQKQQAKSKELTQKQKSLEKQLYQSQKMDAVGKLASGISHDFNNLLSVILGYADLLTTKPELVQYQREISNISTAGLKAKDLIKDLLVFSREQTLDTKSLNLQKIIENFLPLLKKGVPENIRIQYHSPEQVSNILGDQTKIEQVLMNLVINAKDAISKNGTITIEVQNQEVTEMQVAAYEDIHRGTFVRMSIADTGCGIPKDLIEKIFEPFFSTKEKGKGTGLGLSTTFGIVRRHNGFVQVYSEENMGTTFHIYIPASDSSEDDTITASVKKHHIGEGTILLAEDEETLAQLTKTVLESAGYSVIVTSNGMEAFDTFEHTQGIKLFISDVVMPNEGGVQTWLKMKEKHPIPALFVSGYSTNTNQIQEVEKLGAPFLQKPFTPKQLLDAVEKILYGNKKDII